jgi:iron complex outermembrane receptor protein
MLEEIVVTARRREESLMNLPLSIAAITAEAMQTQGIYTIEDIGDFVPNVTLTTSDRQNNTRVVIRGIGGGHPDPVFVFGSGMYLDGHYMPNSLGGYMSTLDIERVELLRGPQGTLFGKNVTGGAVNIISAKPGPDFESKLTLRSADDGDQTLRGMINFPINDKVFARVAFASEKFDGYYYNHNLGITQGAQDRSAVNASLRFIPDDNWTIDLSVNRQQRNDDNLPIQCNPLDGSASAWGSKGGARLPHLDRKYYSDAQAADGTGYVKDHAAACKADAAAGQFVTSSDKFHFSDLSVNSAFLGVQWDSDGPVGGLDNLTFKGIASYRATDYDYQQDRDGSFYDIDNIGMPVQYKPEIGQDNLTRGWEMLLEGVASDRLSFVVGVNSHYELAKNGNGACRRAFVASGYAAIDPVNPTVPHPSGFGVIPNPASGDITKGVNCGDLTNGLEGLYFDLLPGQFLPFMNSSRIENQSIAVFGHLTYTINDNWDLDLGVRWTEDDREFWNLESGIQGCNIEEVIAGGTDLDIQNRTLGSAIATNGSPMCDFNWFVSFESAVLDGFFNEAAATFDEVTPMVSLTRSLQGSGGALDSGMVYALYSEGFLTGGFNTEINSNLPAIKNYLNYGPENVSNYELGFKGAFFDGRLQIMADVFLMDYTNKQESLTIDNPDGVFGVDEGLGVVTNVADVDISGIEFELRASPWEGGFVSVDVGYLDNKYGAFRYPDASDPSIIIDETNTTIRDLTAAWTLNVGIEHTFQLASGGTLTPRVNIYSEDDYDYRAGALDSAPTPCNQPSYTKTDVRFTYVPAAANWQASLFGNNITDENIYLTCTASRGVYRYSHQRPAWWGIEFSANWGG